MASPPKSPGALHSHPLRGPREPTNFTPRAPAAVTGPTEHITPAAELKKSFSKLISKGTALTGTKKGNRPDFGDLDERIARYKAKKEKEKAEKAQERENTSRKVDLGPALGQFDTPNVRERIRKWQATGAGVVSGDPLVILPPPIIPFQSPIGSPAGSDCGRSDYSNVGCGVGRLRGSPDISPSRPPKEIMREWETASESGAGLGGFLKRAIEEERKALGLPKEVDETEDEEKMLQRQRGRDREAERLARERERKLRRRSRGPATSVGAISGVEDSEWPRRRATKKRRNGEEGEFADAPRADDDGIRVRGDDDGIRVKPRRKKSRRRSKEREGGSDGKDNIDVEAQTVKSEGAVPLQLSTFISNKTLPSDSSALFDQDAIKGESATRDRREAYEKELKAERDRRAERRKTFAAQTRPAFGHAPSASASYSPAPQKSVPHVAATFPSGDAPPPPPAHTSLLSLRPPEPEEEIELMESEPLPIPMSPSPPPISKAKVPFNPPSPPKMQDFAPARFEDPGIRIYPIRKGSKVRRRRTSGEHKSGRAKEKGKERLHEVSEQESTEGRDDTADYEGSGSGERRTRRTRRRRKRSQSRTRSSGGSIVSSHEEQAPPPVTEDKRSTAKNVTPTTGARHNSVAPSPIGLPTRLKEAPKQTVAVPATHFKTFPKVQLKPTPTKARATVSSPSPPKVSLRPVPPKNTSTPNFPTKVALPKATTVSSNLPSKVALPKSTPTPSTPLVKEAAAVPKPPRIPTAQSKVALPGPSSTPGKVALPGLTSTQPAAPVVAPVVLPVAPPPVVTTQRTSASATLEGFNTAAPPPPPAPGLPAWLSQFQVPPSPKSSGPKPRVLPGGLIENPNVPGTFLTYRRNPPPTGTKKEPSYVQESSAQEIVAPLQIPKAAPGMLESLTETSGETPTNAPKKIATPLGSPAVGKADFASVIEEIRMKIKEKEEKKKAARLGRKHSVLRSAGHVTRAGSIRNVTRAPSIRNVARAPSIRNSAQLGRALSRKRSIMRVPSKSVRLPKVQGHIKQKQPAAEPRTQTIEEFKSVVDGYESDILETMKTMATGVADAEDTEDASLSPPLPPPAPLRISRPPTPVKTEEAPAPKRRTSVKPQRKESHRLSKMVNDVRAQDVDTKNIPENSTDKQAADKALVNDVVQKKLVEEYKADDKMIEEHEDMLVKETALEVSQHQIITDSTLEKASDGSMSPPIEKPKSPTVEIPVSVSSENPSGETVDKPKLDILEQVAAEQQAKSKDKKKKKHRKKKDGSSKLTDPPMSSNTSLTESYLTRSTPRSSTTTLVKDVTAPTPAAFAIPSSNISPPRGLQLQSQGTTLTQKDKYKDRPPKLSEMTSAFFKALKQEFQGVSVKSGQESNENDLDEHGKSIRQKQAEIERSMEEERQRELAIEADLEHQRQLQWEREMEKERERQRAIELEIELEKEKERQAEREKELEEQRKRVQEEEEKWRIEVERERERQRELAKEIEITREKEKMRLAELEKEREVAEQRRQEMEKEKERRRQLELEKERRGKIDEEQRLEKEKQLAEERARQEDRRRQSVASPLSSAGVISPPPQKSARNGHSFTSSSTSSTGRDSTPSPSITTAQTSPPPSRGSSTADSAIKSSIYSQLSQPHSKTLGPSPLQKSEVVTPMNMMNPSGYELPGQVNNGPTLTRKYTSHADLISMLSVKRRQKSHRTSARTHSNATTATALTIPELIEEFVAAEKQYMRELKTLVDDVIPVLLSTVLERADNHVAARQFGAGALSGKLVNPTRPIVDMGIALERIKRLHEGIPKQDSDKLLRWAQDGKSIYEEFLRAWRMGFQDVIVTMAPAEADYNLDSSGWDADSRRQLVSRLGSFAENFKDTDSNWQMPAIPDYKEEEEEKVDVAFLLKRPLVRLRILAKVLKRVDDIRHSPLAETCAVSYHALVTAARKKVTDEKARIEDEAAAAIDVSKAFDIHTFAPMPNITLNSTRKVRARDCFIMHMPHSTGQIIQRNVEFILRDEGAKERGLSRDSEVLICEVPVIGRLEKWLLFQPIPLKSLSARTGDDVGEIVVMVRGRRGGNPEWREVMVLKTTNDMAAFEWVQMLGLLPVPPMDPFEKFRAPPDELPPSTSSGSSGVQSRSSTPETVKGNTSPKSHVSERSRGSGKSRDSEVSGSSTGSRGQRSQSQQSITEESRRSARKSSAGSRARSATPPSRQNTITPVKRKSKSRESSISTEGRGTSKTRPLSMQELPTHRDDDERSDGQRSRTVSMSSIASTVSSLKRSAAIGRAAGQKRRAKSVSSLASISTQGRPDSPNENMLEPEVCRHPSTTSTSTRSSMKSERTHVSRRQSKRSEGLSEITEEKQSRPSSVKPADEELCNPGPGLSMGYIPVLAPVQKSDSTTAFKKGNQPLETPPPPPPHRVLTPGNERDSKNSMPPPVDKLGRTKRRTSSPLKHEYEPSTASEEEGDEEAETEGEDHDELYSDEEDGRRAHGDNESDYDSRSDTETLSETDSETDSESETESESEDSISECVNPRGGLAAYPEPTLEINQGRKRIIKAPITPIPEESEGSTTSPKPRKASSQSSETSVKSPAAVYKGLAHIFSWSANAWQKFHPDECKIIVTSGRIEAYPNLVALAGNAPLPGNISQESPASPSSMPNAEPSESTKPLVIAPDAAPAVLSLELAPTTPIRRGTAVDLSIRTSPSSQFCGNSVMFRCRSPGECEALYNAINSARVSNATYHPLPNVQNKYHSYLDPDGAPIHPPVQVKRGWGSWGRSGYRAGSSKAPSIISSEGSVGSFSSAFSVFKRFSFGKGSSGGSSFGSVTSETSTASSLPGLVSGLPGVPGGPISMSGLKIRLYKRESASKWRDLGPARLSILKPPIQEGLNKVPEEKRIVVRDKTGKVVLLDETLGEQCFERVARTGIAVSILVGELGPDGQKGISDAGGLGAKNTVYMLQMKSEAETVYTFSIVGKHRY